jgi:hypothetical protein
MSKKTEEEKKEKEAEEVVKKDVKDLKKPSPTNANAS